MRDPRRPCGHEPWVVAAVVWCFAGWAAGSGELDQLAICCCDGQPVSVVTRAVPRSSASCAYRHRPAASHAEDAVHPLSSGASRCRWIGAASRRCMQSPTCEPRGHPLAAADPGQQDLGVEVRRSVRRSDRAVGLPRPAQRVAGQRIDHRRRVDVDDVDRVTAASQLCGDSGWRVGFDEQLPCVFSRATIRTLPGGDRRELNRSGCRRHCLDAASLSRRVRSGTPARLLERGRGG